MWIQPPATPPSVSSALSFPISTSFVVVLSPYVLSSVTHTLASRSATVALAPGNHSSWPNSNSMRSVLLAPVVTRFVHTPAMRSPEVSVDGTSLPDVFQLRS
jgi:hypothetical protein